MKITDLKPGDEINISYTGYWVRAKVLNIRPGYLGDWVEVEQITDFEDTDIRPTYDAHIEFCSWPNESIKPPPFGPGSVWRQHD